MEHEGRHTWDVLSEEQIERAFSDAGGVAPELEEAADMGSADGLGADSVKPLLDVSRAELGAALAASRIMLEHAPGEGEEIEQHLRSFVDKVEAFMGMGTDLDRTEGEGRR
jgi:hypothetical protein